jgi:hypothetical protein
LSERQSQPGPGPTGPDPTARAQTDDGGQKSPPDGRPPASSSLQRANRIRRLRELVQDADYDVPSDEVAARIIRDALFGAPGPDEPS